jgi:hypothetical protein
MPRHVFDQEHTGRRRYVRASLFVTAQYIFYDDSAGP